MNQIYKEIGKKIREKREKIGVTQDDLALKVKLSRTSITNIEKGNQHIQIHTLYEIAEVIGVDVIELLPSAPKKSLIESLDDLDSISRQFVELVVKEENNG